MFNEDEKILLDIETKSDGLRDYSSFLKYNIDYKYKKQQQKLLLATLFAIVYTVIALGALMVFRNDASILLWPLKLTNNNQEIIDLQKRVNSLSVEISKLEMNVSTSTVGVSTINSLEKRMFALEDSINMNPEKAVTAILIRDQQKNLEINFNELKESQIRLSDKVDGFITSVIIVPVIGFLLALLAWFIQVQISKKQN